MIDDQATHRWEGRVWASRIVRLVAFLVPVLAAVAAAIVVSRLLPRPDTGIGIVGWWAALIGVATAVMVGVDRLARKLLPLAVLMRMTMIFPDDAPSRMKVVRRAGSTKRLEERMNHAKLAGQADLAEAAENILALVAALNAHDRLTRGHAERVRIFTDLIAEELSLPERDRDRLRWSSLLHDIGKLDVHADILNKPDRPSDEEWEKLRAHPAQGRRLLGPIEAWLGEWAPAVEQHHEKFDGTGYPQGLAGTEISYAARIVAVADAYDAITAARSYKSPIRAEVARQELAESAGTHFDPTVIRAFLNVSIGKIRWVIGPASWFAQIPFIGGLERIGRDLAVLGAAILLFFGAAGAGLVDLPSAAASGPATGTTVADAAGGTGNGGSAAPSTSPTPSSTVPPIASTTPASTTTTAAPTTSTTMTMATTTTTTSPTATAPVGSTTTTTSLPPLRPPTAVDDVVTTTEDTQVTIAVLENDTDPDGDALVVAAGGPESATGGLVACSPTICTYSPSADFFGTDTFTYVVSDQRGGTDTGTVTITVAPVNDAPVARDDATSTTVDTPITVFVLANDSDPEGDQRTIVAFDTFSAAGGTVTCTSSCTYVPPAAFVGADSFSYTIADPDGATSTATVTITVN